MSGGDASPCDLPDCEAVDARASLARRVGASVALGGVAIPLLISVQGIAKAIAICMCAWWSSYSSIDICSNNKHNENILLRMYFMNNKY